MTDRIDSMSLDELKVASRRLLKSLDGFFGNDVEDADLREALAAFQPSRLDRLRKFLADEGWTEKTDGSIKRPCVVVHPDEISHCAYYS